MKICMIGAGYVGLVSAACFSDFGWQVTCVDKDPDRIAMLRAGRMPIYEPGLDDLVIRNTANGRLTFTEDLASAVRDAELVFLAVGTPMRRGDGYADLTYIYQAVEEIAPHLTGYTVITTKSTVPVGTSREIEKRLKRLGPDAEFSVCSNPEFLREGSAISDFTHPDRVLVGVEDDRAREVMTRVYRPLALRKAPILFSSREAAEVSKYAANAFLAMKISFINEIADLCEHVGADVQEVANAIGADGRIGDKFLHPGPGYGGSCFPKDVSALIRDRPRCQIEERKIAMANRIIAAAGGDVFGKTIGVLGVTFKPNTDDMRDAPSLVILPRLLAQGASVQIFDPHGREQGEALLEGVMWCENALAAARDCDVLVVLTEWNEFRALDLKGVATAMRGRILVDLRNVFLPADAEPAGLLYTGIGRPSQTPGSAKNGLAAPQPSAFHAAG